MRTVSPSTWVALAAGTAFAWLAVPGPHLYDSPALVAGAWDLAATYPPGQPLHALLGRAVAVALPLGPIPWRVALLSAAGEAASAWLAGRLAVELLRDETVSARALVAARLAATVGALLAPPLLRQALRVEVYGPALAVTAYGLVALVRWTRRDGEAWLRVGALCAALAAALHPPHGFAVVLWGVAAAVVVRRDVWRRPRALGWTTVAFVAGMSVFALLPVRELAGVEQWGEPTTLSGFWRYVSGAPYHGNLGGSVEGTVLGAALYVLGAAGAGACLGAVLLAARRTPARAVRLSALVALALLVVPASLQEMDARIPDRAAYAGPAVIALLALGAAGFVATPSRRWITVAGLLLLALHPGALVQVPASVAIRTGALETLVGSFTDAPPPRAVVLVSSDVGTLGWRMARSVDGARPDVGLLPTGTIGEGWQWRSASSHPALAGPPPLSPPTDREGLIERAIARVDDRVPISSEKRRPGLDRVSIAGPYVLRPPRPPPGHDVVDVAMSEAGPFFSREDGDPGNVGSLLRNVALNRGRRLVDAGRGEEALALYAHVLAWLPADERALLAPGGAGVVGGPLPVAHDPEALFEASREDAVREAAAALWRVGRGERAAALLEAQSVRGDPRALLQLAWMALADGRTEAARQAVEAFEAGAGARAEETRALRHALTSAGR